MQIWSCRHRPWCSTWSSVRTCLRYQWSPLSTFQWLMHPSPLTSFVSFRAILVTRTSLHTHCCHLFRCNYALGTLCRQSSRLSTWRDCTCSQPWLVFGLLPPHLDRPFQVPRSYFLLELKRGNLFEFKQLPSSASGHHFCHPHQVVDNRAEPSQRQSASQACFLLRACQWRSFSLTCWFSSPKRRQL